MKLYSDEAGHQEIRGLESMAISCLARVEVPAAIWRKHRLGELGLNEASLLVGEFEADYYGDPGDRPRFAIAALPGGILADAARLAATHGLRAYDSVQLASARAVRGADPSCISLACFDGQLRRAAAADGFDLIPSES